MSTKGIIITQQLKEAINEFLGAEFIPACAVGNELIYVDGSLVIKTFGKGNIHGFRKLALDGELINIITEFYSC